MANYDSQTDILNRHDYNATQTAEYDTNQTNNVVITPESGKRIKVKSVYFSTQGATTAGQKIRVHFASNTVATFFPAETPSSFDVDLVVQGGVDEALRITSDLGNGKNYYLAIDYKIV